jgi:hypothetical protein
MSYDTALNRGVLMILAAWIGAIAFGAWLAFH